MGGQKFHEAGFDVEVTARNMIRLSAKMDDSHQVIVSPAPPSPTCSEARNLPGRGAAALPGNSGGIGRLNPNPFAALDLLSFDDEEPSEPEGEVRLMMPRVSSTFWTRYGNKIRCNGTVEGECVVR